MSNFSNPKVIELLTHHFVPVAFDQWYERRQKDTRGDFYRSIMKQGSRNDFERTTQGKYAVAPDGKLLGETNHRDPKRLLAMLEAAIEQFKPSDVNAIQSETIDETFARIAPENGLTIRVNTKVLGGYENTENSWRKIFQNAIARDNLWITSEEQTDLAQGQFPGTVLRRMAKYNLVDNTRGEPPMWKDAQIIRLKVQVRNQIVRGEFHLETADKSRGFVGELYGHIESKDKQVTRFDIVAQGEFWGEGRYTPRAPEGRFPIAIAFRLADGTDPADQVAPQGTKGWLENYWK